MEHNTSLSQSIISSAVISNTASTLSEQFDCLSSYSMLSLASKLININEDILLKKHGYIKKETIGSASQGEIFLASKGKDLDLVVIKKIAKDLYEKKECIEDVFTFITDTNIVKETLILKNIAQKSNPNNKFIIQYLDSFESDDDYYLVTEYIEESITLQDF
eukprot:500082_1